MIVENNYTVAIATLAEFLNQWEAKPKSTAPCARDFSRALRKLQVITKKSDWFITLFAPVVIGPSNYFAISLSKVIWKPLYVLKGNNNYKYCGGRGISVLYPIG